MCSEGGGEVDKVGPLTDNLAHMRISQSGPIGPHDQLAPEPPADNTPYMRKPRPGGGQGASGGDGRLGKEG